MVVEKGGCHHHAADGHDARAFPSYTLQIPRSARRHELHDARASPIWQKLCVQCMQRYPKIHFNGMCASEVASLKILKNCGKSRLNLIEAKWLCSASNSATGCICTHVVRTVHERLPNFSDHRGSVENPPSLKFQEEARLQHL